MEKRFGLIGLTVSHSFSKTYFDEKFFRDGLRDYHYDLIELKDISEIKKLIADTPDLCGLNVTVPYKEKVMAYLDELSEDAKKIGAVNVIKIKDGKLKGYNTDSDAFLETVSRWFPNQPGSKALILGSGGSSKAVQQAFRNLNIPFTVVSRSKKKGEITFDQLNNNPSHIKEANLIVNTTPLGMVPNTTEFPPIDYNQLTNQHYVYDLIYNPARTIFLQKAEIHGSVFKNGLEMLHVQAEKAWEIWSR
ncbi:MAG: shikimate dehydrogenase [Flammeovirgaceae bacterium]|nr:shikimate dehydrogenase [Flammeovirgaceae bacterium]